MENKYIISEDSRIGLLFWALTNHYIFNDSFKLRFCNKDRPTQNIYLDDINNWENVDYLKQETSSQYITAGIDKFPDVAKHIEAGSKVLLALDMLGFNLSRGEMLKREIKAMQSRGIRVVQVRYNCGADFLLGFVELKEWCLRCYPKPDIDNSAKVYWDVLDAIQRELAKKNIQFQALKIWEDWTKLPESRRYGVTPENRLEALLHEMTKNSYLWYKKDSISDCWTYDCCYEKTLRNGKTPNNHGCISEKWQYIYDHSTLKQNIEDAMKYLDIPIPQRVINKISVKAPYRIRDVRYHGTNAKNTDGVTWSQDGPNRLFVIHPKDKRLREFYMVDASNAGKIIYSGKIDNPKGFRVCMEGDDSNSYSPEYILEKFSDKWTKTSFKGDNKAFCLSPCVYVCSESTTPLPTAQSSESPQSNAPTTASDGQASMQILDNMLARKLQPDDVLASMLDGYPSMSEPAMKEWKYLVYTQDSAGNGIYYLSPDLRPLSNQGEVTAATYFKIENERDHVYTRNEVAERVYSNEWQKHPSERAVYFKYRVRVVPIPTD